MYMSYKGKYRPENPKKYKGDPTNIVYRSLWERKFMRYSWAYKVQTWVKNQAKWKAAKEFCADRNYEFRIMTEEDLGI